MSGSSKDRAAARAVQEAREGQLVFARIKELQLKPLTGKFDVAHLCAIHAYLFQDTPRHSPGEIREDTGLWSKRRALEDGPGTYDVPYLADGVAARLKAVLDDFGGPAALCGLSPDAAANRLARLYGDLDHAHGFYEGNSRTLREFTRTLAGAAGFVLDWTGSTVTAEQRNCLYAARDLEVITRHYPGVTPETAKSPAEYEAVLQAESFRAALGEHPLRDIIRRGLSAALTETQAETARAGWSGQAYWSGLADKASPSSEPTKTNDLAAGPKLGPKVK